MPKIGYSNLAIVYNSARYPLQFLRLRSIQAQSFGGLYRNENIINTINLMPKYLIVGNWKMHGTLALADQLAGEVAQGSADLPSVDIVLCPPSVYLPAVIAAAADTGRLSVGAQDVSQHETGAFTGEISAAMLRDIGCSHVIAGHSERRSGHRESDAQVAAKVKAAMRENITPIVCVGETLEQRQSERTQIAVERQVQAILDAVGADELAQIAFAYEPVWAIGTGRVASPQQVQQVHAWIRSALARKNPDAAQACRILYGGSVNEDNVAGVIDQPDVDGCLVGGASLQSQAFLNICRAAV